MAYAMQAQQLPGMGLLALQDKLATAIARLFVQQSRFDPLRSAAAEQALYNGMAEALTELQSQTETQLKINGYQARVTREDLQPIGREFRERLQGLQGPGPLIIEYPLNLLPGLDHDGSVIALDRSAMVALLQRQWQTLKQPREQLALTRAVAANDTTDSQPTSVTDTATQSHTEEHPKSAPAPTHLLIGNQASPIGRLGSAVFSAWSVSQQQGQWWVEQAPTDGRVNERTVTAGAPLQVGDTLIDSNGTQALLIYVED